MNLKSVFSATAPMSMLFGGATMVVLAGVTLSPPPAQISAAPAVQLVSVATPLPAGGDNDSGSSEEDLFSTGDGSRGTDRHQNGFSGRGFSERQEHVVREEKQKSWWDGFTDGFDFGHDLGSSAPAPASSGGGDHDGDKSKKNDNDDLKDELKDFEKDIKKIAKSQGDSGGGDSSDGKSSKGDDGESAQAGSGQGGIGSLLAAAIGQFITALLGAIQGSPQS